MGAAMTPPHPHAQPAGPVLHIYPGGGHQSSAGSGPLIVQGLVAELVLALISHGPEIAGYPKGSTELHWGPNGVQGRFHPLWDATVDPGLRAHFTPPSPGPHVWPPQSPRPAQRGGHRQRAVQSQGRQSWRIRGTETPPWEQAPATVGGTRS